MVDDRGGGGTAELVFERHPVFHPDEEVVQIWREAAEEHVGAGLVVVVRDSRAWDHIWCPERARAVCAKLSCHRTLDSWTYLLVSMQGVG